MAKYKYANRDRYYSDVVVYDIVDNSKTIYRKFHSTAAGAKHNAHQRGNYYNNHRRDSGQYVTSYYGKIQERYKKR